MKSHDFKELDLKSMPSLHVLTFMAPPQTLRLTTHLVRNLADCLESQHIVWLSEQEACDIYYDPVRTREAMREVHALCEAHQIDFISQPQENRKKKLFMADMDSTIIGQECMDELADYVGKKEDVAAITERTMRGELEFDSSLRARVAFIRGLQVEVVEQVLQARIHLNPGARCLLATLKSQGIYTVLISGGFTLFAQRIAELAGFEAYHANMLLQEEGRFTGYVQEPILGRDAKLKTLLYYTEQRRLSTHESLAIGDGANDLWMLQAAGLGIAYHAKPQVAAAAHGCITYGDLTAVLFALGYSREAFVEDGHKR